MKILLSISAALLLIISQGYCAKAKSKYGNASLEEVQMTSHDMFPDAKAVVLHDYGYTETYYSDPRFKIRFVRRYRIKILHEDQVSQGDVSIRLYNGSRGAEKLIDLQAMSHNYESGKVVKSKLKKKDVFETNPSKNSVLYRFSIPSVKVGSVIEVTYSYTTPYISGLPEWYFQHDIPCAYSSLELSLLPIFKYQIIMSGHEGLPKQSSYEESLPTAVGVFAYNKLNYRYEMSSIPAFDDESFISSPSDYIAKLDGQLASSQYPGQKENKFMTTWPELSTELLDNLNLGKFCYGKNKSLDDILESMDLIGLSQLEKVEKITLLVKKQFHWNHRYSMFSTQSMNDLVLTKEGSSGDLNLMLISLLKKAGLNSKPVILSTRGHGLIYREYPFYSYFNYLIAAVEIDSKLILLDGTDPYLAYNKLPLRCMNGYGLIIYRNSDRWVDISDNKISKIDTKIKIIPNVTGENVGLQVSYSYTGYDAYNVKRIYRKGEDVLITGIESDGMSKVSNLNFKTDSIASDALVLFDANALCEKIGNQYFIAPFIQEPPEINPFKKETRKYPVDFIYRKQRYFESIIELPEGFVTDFKPESFQFNDNKIGSINYSVEEIESKIIIKGGFAFYKRSYSSEDYVALKKFYGLIVDKLNQKVILEAN